MTAVLKSAHVVYDVEDDISYIETMYSKLVPDEGYKTFCDYLRANPVGEWTKDHHPRITVFDMKSLSTL